MIRVILDFEPDTQTLTISITETEKFLRKWLVNEGWEYRTEENGARKLAHKWKSGMEIELLDMFPKAKFTPTFEELLKKCSKR